MPQSLDYEQSTGADSRMLSVAAGLAGAYPLLLLGALYGQWLLSWWMLGHAPEPSVDDPKYIDGASWMHPITFVALVSFLPVCAGALALNTIYIVYRRPPVIAALLRIGVVVALWIATELLLAWDPGGVVFWWFD